MKLLSPVESQKADDAALIEQSKYLNNLLDIKQKTILANLRSKGILVKIIPKDK